MKFISRGLPGRCVVTWFHKAEEERSRSDFPFPSEQNSMWWKRMLGLSSGWNYNIDEHVLIFLEPQAQIVVTKWCNLVPNSRRWEILILYFQWRIIVRWRRMLGLPSGWGKTGGLLTHIGTAQPSPRPEFLILFMFKLFFYFDVVLASFWLWEGPPKQIYLRKGLFLTSQIPIL